MEKKSIFQLIHTVEQMNNEYIIRFTKRYPYPIGVSPILVLAELRTKGPRKQVELAEVLGYTKGAMTSIANKLVSLDLAERMYDETDRRIIQLRITEKGNEAFLMAQKIGEEMYMELYKIFTPEEIATYLSLQQKLLSNAKKNIRN
ncbi:MarR family transcriptional regulator [Solibacillus sp. R5-41]|uniref:MarR family winged helix-turn-helix transcriptional regulator n=1 Tax=Solibacillus sp. R5-41 TaxID=2048654 RepID=UPI000C12612A|nr:MarR family transcriptional regulator [Solibacillus sp. R5-41]ATP41474.1 MarR family transcriptional regulator [Solibacillus sp. R5-41]